MKSLLCVNALDADDSYINWDLSVVDEHHHDDSVGDDAYLHSDGPDQSQPFVTPRPGPASSAAANDDALFHTPFSPHHQQPPSRLNTDTANHTEDDSLFLPGAGTEPPPLPLPRFGSPSQANDEEDVRDRSGVVAEEGGNCQGGEGVGKGDGDGGGGGDGGNGGDRGRDEDHRLLSEALGRARATAGGSGLKERKRDYGKPWLANTVRWE